MSVLASGADEVRARIAKTIEVELPKMLARLEVAKGLEPGTLASRQSRPGDSGLIPHQIFTTDVPEVEVSRYPAIMIVTEGLPKTTPWTPVRQSADPNDLASVTVGNQFRRQYATTIHVWLMGQGESQLSLAKDRFELALWWTLADNPAFGASNLRLDPSTYVVGFQELSNLNKGGMITGLGVRFQVVALETIATPIRGQADTIQTDVGLLTFEEGE